MNPLRNITFGTTPAPSKGQPFACTNMRIVCALLLCALVSGCGTAEKPKPAPQAEARSAAGSTPPSNAAPRTASTSSTSPSVTATRTDYTPLFDGKTLTGWTITDFAGHGEVKVEDGKMVLMMGVMTGVTWTNAFPKMNYELELDAMRVEGSDFFCGLTFPVGDAPCSLILGGWGGGVVGLSSIDGEDAAHNETSKFMQFDTGRWYHVRLRVVPGKIQAWIDKEKFVDLDTQDRSLSIRIEMELSKPLGIATWSTTGAVKDIRLRKL